MDKHTLSKIISTKYYNFQDVINADLSSKKCFIIANEYKKKSGTVGRYFTIFPDFKMFLKNRKLFPYCHEILVDHKNNIPDKSGRLVFDFDVNYIIVGGYIPNNFKDQIESTILEVVFKYFKNVDLSKIIFIWSSSENTNKLSKHLTVKNIYFEDWVAMTKIFYDLFIKMWKETYDWILASNLIDNQIARNNGSLRMVGSKKVDGNILTFDDKCYKLEDSLIRIYKTKNKHREQIISIESGSSFIIRNEFIQYINP